MSYEARISDSGGRRLLRMLGFGERAEDQRQAGHAIDHQAERANLIAQIGEFLLRHELAVSAENLAHAHGIVTGIDRKLAAKVRTREADAEPITQAWLEENTHHDRSGHETAQELDALAKSMEASVVQFGESSRSAQQAASLYGRDLQRHVEQVEDQSSDEAVIANLSKIARAMLERTREMEEEMRKSELEARQLRTSLEKARRDATIDHLTNLPNRRAFEDVFITEKIAAQNELEPLCVAICDIDFFKKVNDTHGHDTGDRVIRAVGSALDRISDRCHVARHGGEEFALLFRGLDVNGAAEALDGARERFAARHFVDKISGKAIGDVTFSGGVVNVFAYETLSDALRAADEALYRAKEGGRNRIERG